MSDLTYREAYGGPLPHGVVDQNFRKLNNDKLEDVHLDPLRQADAQLDDRVTIVQSQQDAQGSEIDAHATRLTAVEQVAADAQPRSEKGQPSGYCPLDANRKVAVANLPEEVFDRRHKGWFATPEALRAALPVATDGDHAVVGSTDSMWVWDSDSNDWKDTDSRGQVVSVNDQRGEVFLWANHIPSLASGLIDSTDVQGAIDELSMRGVTVQICETADTWFKPSKAKSIDVIVVGAGGGGGGGHIHTGSSAVSGGAGGEGGSIVILSGIPASMVANTVAVVVGAAGTGTQFRADGSVVDGTSGGASTVLFGGLIGQIEARGGMRGGSSTPEISGLFLGSRGGAASENFGNPAPIESTTPGCPGGGGGSGLNASGQGNFAGGAGSFCPLQRGSFTRASGSAGAAGGGNGGDGDNLYFFGTSGGGGGSNPAGSGGRGGHGGGYGAGGGGGGASAAGFDGGAGGDGAPGVVIIITHT